MLATSALRQRIEWFTPERKVWIVVVITTAASFYGLGNGHTTQDAVAHISDQLGQQKTATVTAEKAAGCEHFRARVATAVANQVINSVNAQDAQPPSTDAIPQDNCPHPKK